MDIHEKFFQALGEYVKSDSFSRLDDQTRLELSKIYIRAVRAKELPPATLTEAEEFQSNPFKICRDYKNRIDRNFRTYPIDAMYLRLSLSRGITS